MANFRARVAALLVAMGLLALGSLSANAQSYEQALGGFAADSFSDTDTAITGVAGSGHPLAAKVIGALQDGRLLFNPDDKKIYVREPSGALLDAAAGRPVAGEAPSGLKTVRLNNRLRRSIEAALGGLSLLAPDPTKRFESAQAVFTSRDANALPALDAALAKETNVRVKKAMLPAPYSAHRPAGPLLAVRSGHHLRPGHDPAAARRAGSAVQAHADPCCWRPLPLAGRVARRAEGTPSA